MEGAISVAFVRPHSLSWLFRQLELAPYKCFNLLKMSVHPSVCPSVAYTANNSRIQRHSVSKFGKKVPHLRCDSHTSFKVKQSKDRVTRPINDTLCAISSEWQGLRTSKVVYGWRTMTRISRRRHDLKGQRSRSQGHVISLSRAGLMAHKWKTNSRTITKICTWYSHKVSRRVWPTIAVTSKVKCQGHKLTSSVLLISAFS